MISNVTDSCCEFGVEYLEASRAILQTVRMLAVHNTVASWWRPVEAGEARRRSAGVENRLRSV